MANNRELRALVVDDESGLRKLLKLALVKRGFACDTASDGNEAEERVCNTTYDVVITDLRMPQMNGHRLATRLLELDPRPLVVIHTSVIEPRLAKDLLARGVDDILFKPFDFGVLAAKVRSLVDRQSSVKSSGTDRRESSAPKKVEMPRPVNETPPPVERVSLANIESRLDGLSRILPISRSALDVYNMTSTNQWEIAQIAAAIQRDATLTAEVLRMANSAFYNPSRQRITQLDRAVVQIGQKRTGELALATNALSALTAGLLPWMDVGLGWKQSMAAGLATEMLIEQGRHQAIEEGLLLSAIMHLMGRVVLGTLYPKHYELMTQRARDEGTTLSEQERRVFPLSHSEAVAHLLASWNIPADVYQPLKVLDLDYASLATLPEPIRSKAELLKLAIFVGCVAAGAWEPWSEVDVPRAPLLERLGVTSLEPIIAQTREDVRVLSNFRVEQPKRENSVEKGRQQRELAYCNLADLAFDFVGNMLPAMGIKPVKCAPADLKDLKTNVLVNCLGVVPHGLAGRMRCTEQRKLLILAGAEYADRFGAYGQTLVLPASYERLRAACDATASTQSSTESRALAALTR